MARKKITDTFQILVLMYRNCKSLTAGHCKKWDYFQLLGGEVGDSQPHSVQPQCGEDYHEAAP
jgi:hypothetical protein